MFSGGMKRDRALGRALSLRPSRFFKRAHFAFLKRRKILDLQRSNNEKVTVNSKYYCEHKRTCNILMIFTYMMASKLIYLLMEYEALGTKGALGTYGLINYLH